MALQQVNFGSASDGSQGDTARAAFGKINANFTDTTNAASRLVGTAAGNLLEAGVAGLASNTGQIVSDLNEIAASGFYRAISSTLNTPRTNTLFTVMASMHSPGAGQQLAVTASAEARIYYRNQVSGTWSAWKELDPTAFGIGTLTAPTATDANAITVSGVYRLPFNSANIPVGTSGVLFQQSYDSSSFTQIFCPTATVGRLFIRNKFGSASWTPWRESAMSDAPSFTTSLQCSGPIRTGQYTLARLPSASAWTGYENDVTDAAGGAKRCRSDGTNWKILNTTTTVS